MEARQSFEVYALIIVGCGFISPYSIGQVWAPCTTTPLRAVAHILSLGMAAQH